MTTPSIDAPGAARLMFAVELLRTESFQASPSTALST